MLSKNLEHLTAHYGCQPAMCGNCAFRPGSGEVADFGNLPGGEISQLQTILEHLDAAVEGESDYYPFFCHQGMPTTDGGETFQPLIDSDGTPIGYKICAGWLNEVHLQQNDPRRGSNGKRFSSLFRVWDRVSKAKKEKAA